MYVRLLYPISRYHGNSLLLHLAGITFHSFLVSPQGKTILEDARRINVALTRAKKKLIMFGNGSVLCLTACMSKLMGILEQKGFISIISGMDKIWFMLVSSLLVAVMFFDGLLYYNTDKYHWNREHKWNVYGWVDQINIQLMEAEI